MAGYSSTPLWKKLGYKAPMRAHVDGAPDHYFGLLSLPAEITVTWIASPKAEMEFVHSFVTSTLKLKAKLQLYRKQIVPAGIIWISWPKKSSGVATDVTENVIRDVALPLGLVDIKVCAIDDVWSGLKLVIRKDHRQGSEAAREHR